MVHGYRPSILYRLGAYKISLSTAARTNSGFVEQLQHSCLPEEVVLCLLSGQFAAGILVTMTTRPPPTPMLRLWLDGLLG